MVILVIIVLFDTLWYFIFIHLELVVLGHLPHVLHFRMVDIRVIYMRIVDVHSMVLWNQQWTFHFVIIIPQIDQLVLFESLAIQFYLLLSDILYTLSHILNIFFLKHILVIFCELLVYICREHLWNSKLVYSDASVEFVNNHLLVTFQFIVFIHQLVFLNILEYNDGHEILYEICYFLLIFSLNVMFHEFLQTSLQLNRYILAQIHLLYNMADVLTSQKRNQEVKHGTFI